MTALYNEIEPFAVEWTRELIKRGHVAPGRVEPKSITELTTGEFYGATQAHFFAGIGVWSYALRLAGWPDDREIWTGSCPCQPFSGAGKRKGAADERHLWPAWFKLIKKRRPAIVVGEQVASPAGRAWLDDVSADLESAGYAVGAADIPAASVGSPHLRQRLYFVGVADADATGRSEQRRGGVPKDGDASQRYDADGRGAAEWLADSGSQPGRLIENPNGSTPTSGLWSNPEWVYCRDGKYRPVEPGSPPLVDGATARVGRLRGYGNAINAEVAATFIRAVMEVIR